MNQFETIKTSLLGEQKKWLVSGCAGFIGSNLIEFLLSHNQIVVGIDNFSTGHRHNIDDVLTSVGEYSQNFHFFEGDVTDYPRCMEVCEGVDIVLHQAALGSVPRSIGDPISSNHSNVTGFLTLMTAAKECGVRRFVYASSSSVYGDSAELPKVESRTGRLLSPYAVTKMTNELYGGVFAKTYGMETIGLRYFNVFGRRQDPNGAYAAVIPKWIASLLSGESVAINGDGETSRDFTYIDNIIQLNILAGTTQNPEAFGEAFNGAVGGRNTLNELYSLIVEKLQDSREDIQTTKPLYRDFRAGDIRHSNADITKAKTILGYEPTHTIEQGMNESIVWYIDDILAK